MKVVDSIIIQGVLLKVKNIINQEIIDNCLTLEFYDEFGTHYYYNSDFDGGVVTYKFV